MKWTIFWLAKYFVWNHFVHKIILHHITRLLTQAFSIFNKGASKCPITVILLNYLLVQIHCLTLLLFVLPTDSIMALYAPKSQNNQPQMYNVPGGVYITPQQHQQQPRPAAPAMFNRMGSMPVHGVSMGMGPQLGNPHQQMQQRQQQQQQQVKLFVKSPFYEWRFL